MDSNDDGVWPEWLVDSDFKRSPPQKEVFEPLWETYGDMLMEDPCPYPSALQDLFQARKPRGSNIELVALATYLSTALGLDVNGLGIREVFDDMVDSGLPEALVEIILDDDFMAESPVWTSLILECFAKVMKVTDEGEHQSKRLIALADDLLSMTDQIWDALWTNRIFYTRGGVYAPFEADTRDAIVHIVCGYLGLLHWRNKRVDLNATKASRVAFLCWYHTPPEEHARDNLTVFMTFTSNATAPELGVFIEDIVCEVLGAEAILFRFKRELEQPSLVDMSLVVCMRIFQLLRKHPSVDNLIGPHALFRNAAVALKRQREKGGKSTLGRQCEWYAIAWSASLLKASCSSRAPIKLDIAEIVQEHNLFGIMVRAAILTIRYPYDNHHSVQCIQLIEHYSSIFKALSSSGAKTQLLYVIKKAARKVWYPALQVIRGMKPSGVAPKQYIHVHRAWLALGESLHLDQTKERARFAEKKAGSKCSWKRCEYSAKRPPFSMVKCSGCGTVMYCDRICQKSDWENGGHKRVCEIPC